MVAARPAVALLVASLALGAPSASAAGEPPPPSPWEPTYASVPIAFGVSSFAETSELNADLRREGYSELAKIVPSVSVAFFSSFESGLVVAPQYRFTVVAAGEITLTTHQFVLNAGYEIFRTKHQLLVPLLGAGFGLANLEVATTELSTTSFGQTLREPRHDATLHSATFLLHGGVMAHLWGSGHGDFIGVSTGATLAPVESDWKRRGEDVVDGPTPPMSGGYLAVVVGFAFPWAD